MDIVQLNLALSANPARIREPKFDTVKKGYDPSQVLEYLSRVADRVQSLEDHGRELDSQLKVAISERDEALAASASRSESSESYESVTSRVAELMIGLDQNVVRIREEAEAEAGRILEEANAAATRIQEDAEQLRLSAKETLLKARIDAERAASGRHARQEALRTELSVTCSKVLQMIAAMEASIEQEQNDDRIVIEDLGEQTTGEPAIGPIGIPDAPPQAL
jgi:DivIVA domain-containing protein